jgi:hypothetical protein
MPGHSSDIIRGALMCRHCEEQSDEAISKRLILINEIAALRAQRHLHFN